MINPSATLRGVGLRVTASRMAVLSEVTAGQPMTADQIALAAGPRGDVSCLVAAQAGGFAIDEAEHHVLGALPQVSDTSKLPIRR